MTTTFGIDVQEKQRHRVWAVCEDALQMCNREMDSVAGSMLVVAECIAEDATLTPYFLERLRTLAARRARIRMLLDEIRPMYIGLA